MIKSLLRTAARNLIRNPFFSIINIFGLSAGLSAFLLLFLYVYNEITFDRFHVRQDRIFRLMENDLEYTKGLTLPYLLENFPEVENGTRMLDWSLHRLAAGDRKLNQTIVYADTGFFEVFTFKFLEGNPDEALDRKYGVILTRKLAERLFGREPALNRVIDVDQESFQLVVTGVVDDLPPNSTVEFEALANYETGFELDPWLPGVHDWYNTFSVSYVLMQENSDRESLESKFVPFVESNFLTGESAKPKLNLLPLNKLHNHVTSNESFAFLLGCIAFGIALIATINFINLFTAASSKRVREIGMRKTMGATKHHLVSLFLGEALIISFLAVITGIFFTTLILPLYNDMFQARLEFDVIENPYLLLILLAFWIITGLFAGLVPAWRMTRLSTIATVKGKMVQRTSGSGIGNGFMMLQFAVTIFLIIGTLTIRKQISFMQNHSLNFDAENVIVLRTDRLEYPDEETAKQKYRAFINALKTDSRIVSVTTSSQVPGTYIENYNMFYTDGWAEEESIRLRQVDIGSSYFKTYGIKFLEGNYAREEFLNDTNTVVINHKALVELGAEKGLDNLLYSSSRNGEPFRIIGVVEDFYYQGLHRDIQPLIHYYSKHVEDLPGYISVRVKPGDISQVLGMLKETWQSVPPAGELDYFFADEEINRQYEFVIQTGSLAAFFSVLAMILSCLGLLAMILFVIDRRVKEIGIRKVVGASVGSIIGLFTFQYIKWIFISFLFAAPVALFFMNKWLDNFANQTDISWWVPFLAMFLTVLTAMLTIFWLTLRAASKNPVDSLRYE